MEHDQWWLAIDFGTSNTAAAHVGAADGTIAPVSLTHRSNLLPSAVFVRSAGDILTGDAAHNAAQAHPAGFVAAPKRLIAQPVLRIDGTDVPPSRVVAAVLRTVYSKAVALHNGTPPAHVVLTHPEAWPQSGVATLVEAAVWAGIPSSALTTISEPRAAAHHYTRDARLAPGTSLAVFDFGGGTADVAVLRATGTGAFDVVAARGDNSLGGKNFDALVRRWALEQLADLHPGLRAEFTENEPGSADAIRALDESARTAKEVLSDSPSATLTVAGRSARTTLVLTRDEFDALITPQIETVVALVRDTLVDAAIAPASLHAIYLTGGSSRIPLVHRALSSLGTVATLDDPKTVVAQGALMAARHSGRPAPGPSKPSRARPLAVAGAAVAAAAVAGAVAWVSLGGDDETPAAVAATTSASAPTTEVTPSQETTTRETTTQETTRENTTTAVPITTRTPRVSTVGNTDLQGFVDDPGPRCNSTNEAVAVARTQVSRIVVCRTGTDRLYYKGVRVDDGSGVEIDDPVRTADGFTVTNEGVTYEFDAGGLLISEDGRELAREPMVEFWSVYR